MIKIYPFKAVLPQPEKASQIACEPYDVISADEARQAAAGNDISFLHVVRPEIDFPEGADPYSDAIYEKAAENLRRLMADGLLSEDEQPGMFIYRQVFQGKEQYGIVCCYDVQQYRDEQVKKHEKTRPDKEDDRTRHLTTCSAHAEPVFLSFRDTDRIGELIQGDTGSDWIIDFEAGDGVRHTVWRVSDAAAYSEAFENVDAIYIADGHHRCAARWPLHRPADELLAKLAAIGTVEKTDNPVPKQAGRLCVYAGGGQWYHFEFDSSRIDENDPIESLDVALLQNLILEPILGVGDPRTDHRIGFVGGVRGTKELEQRVDSGKVAIAFSMYPTSIEQLFEVSDTGKIMPPKSTWFEPKLRSGLFVHRFESY